MKNTRWSRLIACLLALVMVFALSLVAANAEDEDGENTTPKNEATGTETENIVTPSEGYHVPLAPAPYKETFDIEGSVIVSSYDKDGKATDLADMDPNKDNYIQLTVTGLENDAEITENTVLTWTIPDDVEIADIESLASGEVTGTINGNMLQLSWLGEKADTVVVKMPVIPHVAADGDLTGSYVLVTADKVMLGAETICPDGRGGLTSYLVNEEGGAIRPLTLNNSVWQFTHVSGNYYTVRSVTSNGYLRIYLKGQGGFKGNGSIGLENVDEANAQKILIERNGDYYTLKYNGYGVNNSKNGKYYAGFASYPAGDAEKLSNYCFKLYSPSDVLDDSAVPLDGNTYYITNVTSDKSRILNRSTISGGLLAVQYNLKNDMIIPSDNIDAWTFTNVGRDWYTIQTGGGYLNISASGASVTGTPQNLLVRSSDGYNTIIISDGDFSIANGDSYALYANDTHFKAVKTNLDSGNQKMVLYGLDDVCLAENDISGTWAITTNSRRQAMIASGTGVASVPYVVTEDGKVYNTEKTITAWHFTKVNGGWYTVSTEDNRYLTIVGGSLTLASSPAEVWIQEYDGDIRITAGNEYAVRSTGTAYVSNNGGKAVNADEWHTLRRVDDSGHDMLIFDANGGTVSDLPGAIVGEMGDVVTLPDMQASQNGAEFIGWFTGTNFYEKDAKIAIKYNKLLTPGSSYTIQAGKQTLYAVYDTTLRDVQFGIRVDGVIQDEPNTYDKGAYKGHFTKKGIRKAVTWVIDISSQKPVNDYYVENDVIAAVTEVPTAEEIKAALKKDGNINFDPETQYIHWYVMKPTAGAWHIDGVIRDKAKVEISYDSNVTNSKEKQAVANTMPGAYQVARGKEVIIGTEKGSTTIKTPSREGYVFNGWMDDSGKSYNEGEYVKLTDNLHLYAQWVKVEEEKLIIKILSDWPANKPAYSGTVIELTAELTGFDDKTYTLQWEYALSEDGPWIPMAGKTGITMTYVLDETTEQYYWRVVANDVQKKR